MRFLPADCTSMLQPYHADDTIKLWKQVAAGPLEAASWPLYDAVRSKHRETKSKTPESDHKNSKQHSLWNQKAEGRGLRRVLGGTGSRLLPALRAYGRIPVPKLQGVHNRKPQRVTFRTARSTTKRADKIWLFSGHTGPELRAELKRSADLTGWEPTAPVSHEKGGTVLREELSQLTTNLWMKGQLIALPSTNPQPPGVRAPNERLSMAQMFRRGP